MPRKLGEVGRKVEQYPTAWNPFTKKLAAMGGGLLVVLACFAFAVAWAGGEPENAPAPPRTTAPAPSVSAPTVESITSMTQGAIRVFSDRLRAGEWEIAGQTLAAWEALVVRQGCSPQQLHGWATSKREVFTVSRHAFGQADVVELHFIKVSAAMKQNSAYEPGYVYAVGMGVTCPNL